MSQKKTGSSLARDVVHLSKCFAIVLGAVTLAGISGPAAVGLAMIVVFSLISFMK